MRSFRCTANEIGSLNREDLLVSIVEDRFDISDFEVSSSN